MLGGYREIEREGGVYYYIQGEEEGGVFKAAILC